MHFKRKRPNTKGLYQDKSVWRLHKKASQSTVTRAEGDRNWSRCDRTNTQHQLRSVHSHSYRACTTQSQDLGQSLQDRKLCYRCGGTPSHPRAHCPAKDYICQTFHRVGHYARVCITQGKSAKQIQAAERVQDCNEGDVEFWDCTHWKYEYTTPYFQSKTETKSCHILKTAPVASLQAPSVGEQIWPLWISQSRDPAMQQIDCEMDNGACCNILPLYKAR